MTCQRASPPPLSLRRRFGLPLRLFRGSSSRLCLVLSDIDHSNSLRSTLFRRLFFRICHPTNHPPPLPTYPSHYSHLFVTLRCSLFSFRDQRQSSVTRSAEMSIPALLFIRPPPLFATPLFNPMQSLDSLVSAGSSITYRQDTSSNVSSCRLHRELGIVERCCPCPMAELLSLIATPKRTSVDAISQGENSTIGKTLLRSSGGSLLASLVQQEEKVV